MSVLELDAKCRTRDIQEQTQKTLKETRQAWAYAVMHPILVAALNNTYLREIIGGAKVALIYRSRAGAEGKGEREIVIKSDKRGYVSEPDGFLLPGGHHDNRFTFVSLNFQYDEPEPGKCGTYHYQFICKVNHKLAEPRLEFGVVNDYSQSHQSYKPAYVKLPMDKIGTEVFSGEVIRLIRRVFTLYLENADQMRGRREGQTISEILAEHEPELLEE